MTEGRGKLYPARAVPVVNKADLIQDKVLVHLLQKLFASSPGVSRLLFTALAKNSRVLYLGEPFLGPFISCQSLRRAFQTNGKDKLSLCFRGNTILEHAVENALQSGAGEIFIVTRQGQEWVEKLFPGDKIRVVVNPFSAQGMSTSVKAAICASHPLTQGIIFALGDQPFIDPEVYRALIKSYNRELDLVTYPYYRGEKGNPQLFDRKTWPLLMKLQGDREAEDHSLVPDGEIRRVETPFPVLLWI